MNKSRGESSFRALSPVKKRLPKKYKVGHTGTLDPFADGLLICMVGSYTKLTEFAHALPKTYTAELKLGEQTDTLDPSGTIIRKCQKQIVLDTNIVLEVFERFTGEICQIPPAYSAIHINGKRAYERAIAGESFDMPTRNVTIHSLQLIRTIPPNTIQFRVSCSTGTYIRTLAADIAEALDTCGYLSCLTRNSIGQFSLADAIDPGLLQSDEHHLSRYIREGSAVYSAVTGNPAITVKNEFIPSFSAGKQIRHHWFVTPLAKGLHTGVFTESGNLIGQIKSQNHQNPVYDFVVPTVQGH